MAMWQNLADAALIGAGATALLDVWLLGLKRLGMPSASFAMVGRWAGHLLRGRVAHVAIAKAPPVRHELAWGWLIHYAIGMAFAGLLVAAQGPAWVQAPTWPPAVAMGVATVVFPLLVMQPAMGAGFASIKTPTPLKNTLRSLGNHTVFGLGLYLSALAMARVG